jgi:hypothetical protein
MVKYAITRDSIVGGLLSDAAAHEAGRFDEIGRRFDGIDAALRENGALTRLRTALAFWGGWIDARDRGWQPLDGTIPKGEWPMLARRIASDLAQDQEISDRRVGARFGAQS